MISHLLTLQTKFLLVLLQLKSLLFLSSHGRSWLGSNFLLFSGLRLLLLLLCLVIGAVSPIDHPVNVGLRAYDKTH